MSVEANTNGNHVTDEVLDYLEERLAPERVRAIRAHLACCPACASLYAHAEELHRDVREKGARHLHPDRLLELSDAPLAVESEEEKAHISDCQLCRQQLAWLRSLPQPRELDPGAREAQPLRRDHPAWPAALIASLRRIPNWGWGTALTGAVVTALLVVMLRPTEHGPFYPDLAHIEPLEVQWPRGATVASDFTTVYRDGLERYAAGDYAGAVAPLLQAAQLNPKHEAVFLLIGSAYLLQGKTSEAIAALERSLANTTDPALIEEAKWQLANAHLAAADPEGARARLEEIVSMRESRFSEAEALLKRLAAVKHR